MQTKGTSYSAPAHRIACGQRARPSLGIELSRSLALQAFLGPPAPKISRTRDSVLLCNIQ